MWLLLSWQTQAGFAQRRTEIWCRIKFTCMVLENHYSLIIIVWQLVELSANTSLPHQSFSLMKTRLQEAVNMFIFTEHILNHFVPVNEHHRSKTTDLS